MILLAWRAADTQADGFLLAICTQSVQSQDQRSECLGSQVFPMELCSWPRSGYSCPCWSLLRGKASGAVRLGFALLEAHSAECWAAYTEERTDLGLSCRSWGCFYLFMALGDTFPASSHNSGVPQWFQASGAAHCCLWNGLDLGFGGPFSLLQAMPWCCRDEAVCQAAESAASKPRQDTSGKSPDTAWARVPWWLCHGRTLKGSQAQVSARTLQLRCTEPTKRGIGERRHRRVLGAQSCTLTLSGQAQAGKSRWTNWSGEEHNASHISQSILRRESHFHILQQV